MRSNDASVSYQYLFSEEIQSHSFTAIYKAHFPDFGLIAEDYNTPSHTETAAHVCFIIGVPQKKDRALDTIAEAMARFPGQSLYQVYVMPGRPNRVGRFLSKRRLRAALEKSQRTQIDQGWLSQQSQPKFDVDSLLASEDLRRRYERVSSDRVLKCQVTIAFWDHPEAESALRAAVSAFMGTLSSTSKQSRLKTHFLSGWQAGEVLRNTLLLKRKKMTTEMTPAEAVPLFEVPHIETGLRAGAQASFSREDTSKARTTHEGAIPFQEGEISLGGLYRFGTLDTGRAKSANVEELRKHTLIVGKTGMGKSTTKNRIVIDMHHNSTPSLLIEPANPSARVAIFPFVIILEMKAEGQSTQPHFILCHCSDSRPEFLLLGFPFVIVPLLVEIKKKKLSRHPMPCQHL